MICFFAFIFYFFLLVNFNFPETEEFNFIEYINLNEFESKMVINSLKEHSKTYLHPLLVPKIF